jgi:DNA-binding CsgD family transcriptional regulator
MSRRERARVLSLIATVRRLHACLGNLPGQLRVVLELATGVNAPRALSSAEIAHYLHIRVGQVSRLEKRALRQLRRTARTHACSGARRATPGLLVFSGFGGVLGYGVATGGVEAARYSKAPSSNPRGLPSNGAAPSVDSLLGINAPPAVDDGWLIILLVLGGVLSIGFLFADKERRSRWLRRPPQ